MPEAGSQPSPRSVHQLAPNRDKGRRRRPILGNAHGITLLEVLITVAIIGIIIGAVARLYQTALERARVVHAKAEIRNIEKLMAPRLLDGGGLPVTLEELGFRDPDPWGRPYVYLNFSIDDADQDGDEPEGVPAGARVDNLAKPLNTHFDLYSTGKDGNSQPSVTARESLDDVVRAGDGVYIGLASEIEPVVVQ